MVKQLLKSFEKEIESSIQVDEEAKEVVHNSIKIDMLSGAKGALELLSKNENFIDNSSNEGLGMIGQFITEIDDAINEIADEMPLGDI